jgi:hypothetical protein
MKLLLINMIVLIYSVHYIQTNSSNKEKLKTNSLSKVEAEVEEEKQEKDFSYYSKMYFRKLFSFSSPLNKCKEENCEFCCLSLNFCGSKEQCENSNITMNILKILFISVCVILISFLLYKIYITDSEPEHGEEDKIDDNTLNLLIGLFIQNRDNRRKFKL